IVPSCLFDALQILGRGRGKQIFEQSIPLLLLHPLDGINDLSRPKHGSTHRKILPTSGIRSLLCSPSSLQDQVGFMYCSVGPTTWLNLPSEPLAVAIGTHKPQVSVAHVLLGANRLGAERRSAEIERLGSWMMPRRSRVSRVIGEGSRVS